MDGNRRAFIAGAAVASAAALSPAQAQTSGAQGMHQTCIAT